MSSASGIDGPGRRGRHANDAAVRLLCALIGATALVAVVLVATVSSDTGSALGIAAPTGEGRSGTITAPNPVASSSVAASSVASGSASIPAQPSSTVPQQLTPAYVQAHFPFPPGTGDVSDAHRTNVAGIRLMQVSAGLAEVKHFYEVSLPTIGGLWRHVLATHSASGAVAGWNGGVFFPTMSGFEPQLFLDDNYYGDQPGVVRIEVDFR